MVVAGITDKNRDVKAEDSSRNNFSKYFPDFTIPEMRFPLRNSKSIINFVLDGKKISFYDHDGNYGMNKLDVDVPDHLIEGSQPIDFGFGDETVIEALSKIRLIEERQGRRGITLLINHWNKASESIKKVVEKVLKRMEKVERQSPLCYFSEADIAEGKKLGGIVVSKQVFIINPIVL